MFQILIVDDDENIAELISLYLTKECFDTRIVHDGEEALQAFKEYEPNLILLDLMLPGMDGYQVCREIRQKSSTPIIMLSAKGEVFDKVLGLELGADDYMTKPFSKTVLVSKIRAIVRRTRQYAVHPRPAAAQTVITHGCFTLHLDSQQVFKDGREIYLSSKEFSLLFFFAENAGTLFTKQQIFSKVWKSETPDDNTILVYIKRLRDKIEENPSKPKHLTTVWGKGYQFFP